jgi:signal transduction histidine kinase/DNA-binding response OmpR family regulator
MINDKIDILVVDDLPEKRLVLESVLADLGANIITAGSGEEALHEVLHHDFAVILLDVNMPGLDGFETATLIRQRRKSAHVPIIFITAYADEMHTAQGYSLGAVDYIFAPVVPEILRSKVRVFVDLFRMTQQVRRQAEQRLALMQEQVARAAAEEANRRLEFLARAGTVLGRSLDYEATARDAAKLAVPVLADLCAVTLAEPVGASWRTFLARASADGEAALEEIPGKEGLPPGMADLIQRVLNGEAQECVPVPLPENGMEEQESSGPTEQEGNIDSRSLHAEREPSNPFSAPVFLLSSSPALPSMALVLPLPARDRIIGVLTLVLGPSGRQFGPEALTMAEGLADRAASALDNALLYSDVRRADRQKNEFLSMLAHELRNPLAPIRNAVQILRVRDPDQPELRWARDVIDRQVAQLVRLVDDLLDVSRITQGKIRLLTEPVAVETIVSQAVETSRPLIDARKHHLTVTFSPDPLWVRGDAVRLAQVLTNLLNNAAKYTDEGGHIWLTVSRDRGEAVLSVRDTGVGIPPSMLASVFELFTQVDRSLDRSQGGLGIGLTLVRHLVQMHGGTVHAHSAGAGQGSEFVVRLSALAMAERLPAADSGLPGAASGTAPGRVLVVDDNRDAAFSLAMLLRLDGFEVRTVYDGPGALDVAESFHPQAVLLDIGLPGMDGYEVARRLRQRPQFTRVLLVAVTGYNQEDDRRRSQEAGFDHYMVKPVDPEVLATLLATHGAQGHGSEQTAFAC